MPHETLIVVMNPERSPVELLIINLLIENLIHFLLTCCHFQDNLFTKRFSKNQ